MTALALVSACDRGAPRDDPPSPSPAAGSPVEIVGVDGGAAMALPPLLPLARILEIARAHVPGEVIEAELEDGNGRPEYEITILTADGRAIETTIDAHSGAIRKSEED